MTEEGDEKSRKSFMLHFSNEKYLMLIKVRDNKFVDTVCATALAEHPHISNTYGHFGRESSIPLHTAQVSIQFVAANMADGGN